MTLKKLIIIFALLLLLAVPAITLAQDGALPQVISGETIPCPMPLAPGDVDGETVITKTVNCAFIGTDLEQHLRDRGIKRLIFTGVVIHNSMDVSIRMAHCLGFDCHLPLDATTAIDVTDTNGKTFAAQDVFDLYAAVLASEYCTLTQSKNVITALPG